MHFFLAALRAKRTTMSLASKQKKSFIACQSNSVKSRKVVYIIYKTSEGTGGSRRIVFMIRQKEREQGLLSLKKSKRGP